MHRRAADVQVKKLHPQLFTCSAPTEAPAVMASEMAMAGFRLAKDGERGDEDLQMSCFDVGVFRSRWRFHFALTARQYSRRTRRRGRPRRGEFLKTI